MKRIHVVAAVIHGDCADRPGDILISKRPDHLHQGGKWEFPGGKVEPDESPEKALRRELKEELAIDAHRCRPLIQVQHDYTDKSVFLDVWEVLAFDGTPKGVEGQQVEWVARRELHHYEFPDANVPILQAVKLPERYWITPDFEGALSEFLQRFEEKLLAGITLVQLRTKSLGADKLASLCQALLPLKLRFDFALMINGDCYALLQESGRWRDVFSLFDGVHLTAAQLTEGKALKDSSHLKRLSASCHNEQEIQAATVLGCQFITLSPVRPTESHPEVSPLCEEDIACWLKKARVPVYALGGMSDSDIDDMRQQGFQGVAGISQLGKQAR